ncbi:hypothetical protein GGG16DRAFT_106902 [Schizophyllum commune]
MPWSPSTRKYPATYFFPIVQFLYAGPDMREGKSQSVLRSSTQGRAAVPVEEEDDGVPARGLRKGVNGVDAGGEGEREGSKDDGVLARGVKEGGGRGGRGRGGVGEGLKDDDVPARGLRRGGGRGGRGVDASGEGEDLKDDGVPARGLRKGVDAGADAVDVVDAGGEGKREGLKDDGVLARGLRRGGGRGWGGAAELALEVIGKGGEGRQGLRA